MSTFSTAAPTKQREGFNAPKCSLGSSSRVFLRRMHLRICILLRAVGGSRSGKTKTLFSIVFGAAVAGRQIYASSGILGQRARLSAPAFVGREWRRRAEKSYDFWPPRFQLNEVVACLLATPMNSSAFPFNLHRLEITAAGTCMDIITKLNRIHFVDR